MSTQEGQGPLLPKACDHCRTRKIRCDRTIPCSNCTTSGLTCRPAVTVREHRPRILVSNNYEKQIELIHDRLLGIEHTLRNLAVSPGSQPLVPQPTPTSEPNDLSSATVHYEGGSSFQHQTLEASELAESLAGKDTVELKEALKSLKGLINTRGALPISDQNTSFSETRAKLPEVEVLPAAFVLAVIKAAKESMPVVCLLYFLRETLYFEQLCQRAYFPTDQLSLGEQTVMFGILYFLVKEYITTKHPIAEEYNCESYAKICQKNFYAGIETYEMLASPSYVNTMALMMATALAQEEGRMSLAWTLSSAAAKHSQSLGYHREVTYKLDSPVEAQRKRFLFWSIYSLDKSLSLILGRASYLQDYDIDVVLFQPSEDPRFAPWDQSTLIFTRLSTVQGQMYEQLYSSSAARKSTSEREVIIESLSASLQQLYDEMHAVGTEGAYAPEILQLVFRPVDVIFLSLWTLLYRAGSSPGEGISAKCFEAARNSLEAHLTHFPSFLDMGSEYIGAYVSWILLYFSFTPFIVIFLHAIASHSNEDIKLLDAVAASLKPVSSISKDCERLYQTCSTFCRVARGVIESRQNLAGTYNEQSDSFVFLENATHQTQFIPSQLPEVFAPHDPTDLDMGEMSMFFGNWLGSNQPVLDLLNMDFANDAI